MKSLYLSFLFICSYMCYSNHISGGQITYQCLGNNVYEIKLTYFWNCAGGGLIPGPTQTVDIIGCSGTSSISLTVNQSSLTPGNGVLAGGLCPTASTLITCKKRIEYLGIVTLPSNCNDWSFSIGSCCRSSSLSNITIPWLAGYFHVATLNNIIAPCNNSPDISIEQLPNFCVNQPACFNLGATEIDGNTLSYALVAAQSSSSTVNYSGSYSGTSPINGISIDPNTGQINFVPNLIGNFVVVVLITEKDANGNVIGTIMRDFEVIVTNCNNQTVSCAQGNITNVTTGTVPNGLANTLQICENTPFCFDVTFSDPDISDSIFVISPNIFTALPGASMVLTYTPGISNSIKVHICWTPPAGSSGLNTDFVLVVKDNACPVIGKQILNYSIDVLPATNAGLDQTICGAQSATINAVGSSTIFAWADLMGIPIPIGANFSCNPCNNPIIHPSITSTYVVTNIGGGSNCKNQDTLVVNVVPDFTLSAGVNITSGCLNSIVQFTSNVIPNNSSGYTYSWSPSSPLSSVNLANTNASYSTAGTYNYTLSVTSQLGCKKQDGNINFIILPIEVPVFTVVPTNTLICSNTNFPLNIILASGNPNSFLYNWYPNTGLNNYNVQNPIANISSNIIYTVVVNPIAAVSCSNVGTTILTITTAITPTISAAGPYCNNFTPQTMTLNPSSYTGNWTSYPNSNAITSTGVLSPNALALGGNVITYTAQVGPCITTASINVNIIEYLPANIIGTVGPYCIYDSMQNIQSVAQYTGGTWSGNGITGFDFTPSVAGVGNHIITYSTNPLPLGLCPDTKTINVIVNEKPQVNALSNELAGCAPFQVNLYSSSVNTGSAIWFFGDGTTANGLNVTHQYSLSGTYSATISYTNDAGCTNNAFVANSFTVYENPIAMFEPSLYTTTIIDAQLEFTNQSFEPDVNSYLWNINGLATYTTINCSYLFTEAGTYTVSLIASSLNSCVDKISIIIKVNDDMVIFVPNAFSPSNGDRINDVFQAYIPSTNIDYSSFSLVIFDRWGEQIYYSDDLYKGWNGKKQGETDICKQDIYVWKISFKEMTGKYYEKIGHVTLLR